MLFKLPSLRPIFGLSNFFSREIRKLTDYLGAFERLSSRVSSLSLSLYPNPGENANPLHSRSHLSLSLSLSMRVSPGTARNLPARRGRVGRVSSLSLFLSLSRVLKGRRSAARSRCPGAFDIYDSPRPPGRQIGISFPLRWKYAPRARARDRVRAPRRRCAPTCPSR